MNVILPCNTFQAADRGRDSSQSLEIFLFCLFDFNFRPLEDFRKMHAVMTYWKRKSLRGISRLVSLTAYKIQSFFRYFFQKINFSTFFYMLCLYHHPVNLLFTESFVLIIKKRRKPDSNTGGKRRRLKNGQGSALTLFFIAVGRYCSTSTMPINKSFLFGFTSSFRWVRHSDFLK